MPAPSRSRRSAAGIAFLVAGAVVLLDLVLRLAAIAAVPWLSLIADAALAAGFVILALSTGSIVVRAGAIAAAAGWLVLGLGTVVGLPMGFGTLAALAAAVGGVVAGIALVTGKEITDRSAVALLVASAVGAALLLSAIGGLALGGLGQVLSALFGAALVVAGVLLHRPRLARAR